jgi:hypothetical protein
MAISGPVSRLLMRRMFSLRLSAPWVRVFADLNFGFPDGIIGVGLSDFKLLKWSLPSLSPWIPFKPV